MSSARFAAGLAAIEPIVRASMYEGYSLYPYRPSSLKNRRRWLFGSLYPEAAAQCEVLVSAATVSTWIRFLCPSEASEGDGLEEQTLDCPEITLSCEPVPHALWFEFGGAGRAKVELTHRRCGAVDRVSVTLTNRSEGSATRGGAYMGAVHAVLISDGVFHSVIDPSPELLEETRTLQNVGLWPALVLDGAAVLASPIILGDHPRVASESSGDHFDATEIDEILAHRIRTLTDDEKAHMRIDPRTRALLERIEGLGRLEMARLHGARRDPSSPEGGSR